MQFISNNELFIQQVYCTKLGSFSAFDLKKCEIFGMIM